MFRITSNITVTNFKPFKCTGASWSRNVDNISDTAKFYMPAYCVLKSAIRQSDNNSKDIVKLRSNKGVTLTAELFSEGLPVSIEAGYNGINKLRFKGFIKRINFSVPLEIECEGYSYLLGKIIINKSFVNTTVKSLLLEITKGTEIKISDSIPEITIKKAVFINQTGLTILQWLKDKMKLYCYFNFDTLYCGGKALENKFEVNHRLGWNTIKDSQLVFNNDKTSINVNIVLQTRDSTGVMKKIKSISTYTNDKVVRVEGYNPNDPYLQVIRDQLQKQADYKNYSGSITTFLEPYVEPGMATNISDSQYPERNGKYFIESVEGSISASDGGRQKIGIGFKL